MTITSILTDKYADNDGVKLHYKTGGSGPLLVLVHGFPDFWYTWRHQIDALTSTHSVVAMDTRGYNLSDAPGSQEAYGMEHLVKDVAAVILTEGQTSATIIGHDWGGTIAWAFARAHPEMTNGLVIVNMPHPDNITAAVQAGDNAQANAFSYAADFRRAGSEAALDSSTLAGFVARTESEKAEYVEAFDRSDFSAMMNYYRMNARGERELSPNAAPIDVPVLQLHGLEDPTLLAESLNNTWLHLDNTWTLVTIPNAGHNAHHDQPELVNHTIHSWLSQPATAPRTTAIDPSGEGCCAIEAPEAQDEPAGCCS